jgi:hypothetical protein
MNTEIAAQVLAALFACYAMGYGIGSALAWIRRIRDVA